MKDLQITVMSQGMTDGSQVFASQAEGMLNPLPMKTGRIRGGQPCDALVAGVLAGIDAISNKLSEGDHILLRLAGGARAALPPQVGSLGAAIAALRRKGVDIVLDDSELPAELQRKMMGHIELGAALRL